MPASVPGPEDLQSALALVARAIAHSLELRDVWDRVSDACRLVVPFDGMAISRFEAGDLVRVHATGGDTSASSLEEVVFARSDFSPRLRPDGPGQPPRGRRGEGAGPVVPPGSEDVGAGLPVAPAVSP